MGVAKSVGAGGVDRSRRGADGGDGDDVLYSDEGDDDTNPGCSTGGGRNFVYGGSDDYIRLSTACSQAEGLGSTRSPDTISCGPGRDIVSTTGQSTKGDRIAKDCELVGPYWVGCHPDN